MLFSRRSFRVPLILQPFHGRDISVWGLVLVYGFGLGMTIALFVLGNEYFNWLPLWKKILLFGVILDMAAGIPANLTAAVKEYYLFHPRLQKIFPLLHFIQPLLLYFIFMNGSFFYGFLYLYAAGAAYFLPLVVGRHLRNTIALLSISLGAFLLMFVFKINNFLFLVSLLYMTKLILCFSGDTALEL
jgi:hypothetical protein